jgi:putative redox protein
VPNTRSIRLNWTGEGLQFEGFGGAPDTPPIMLDGEMKLGPTPMDTLLIACAGCAGADVVSILKKMKVNLESVSVEVSGERRAEHPKRYTALKYLFRFAGDGLDRTKAERAVTLSLEKYCSVLHSLNPDTQLDHEIELT